MSHDQNNVNLPQNRETYFRIKRHLSELTRLSFPIVISRTGIILLMMADIIMVGHYSSVELAYMGIASTVIISVLVTSMGLIMGTMVLTANAFGAGDFTQCGVVWRRSLLYSLGLGCIGIIVGFFGEGILLAVGQSKDLSRGGGEVMMALSIGVPGQLLFLTSAFFLEGIKRPVPAVVVMVIANIINLALNWGLIYGNGGMPEMGAVGAAWASSIARWALALLLIAYIWFLKDHVFFGIRAKLTGGWKSWQIQRRLGYGSAVSVGAESFSFAVINIFAGWLGALEMAAFSISMNILTFMFMVAIGLGSATAVRVGIAYGRKDMPDLALVGWTGLGLNTLFMAVISVLFFIFPAFVAGLYSNDPELLALVTSTVIIIGLALIVDSGQAVVANALRGRRDVWLPSAIQGISFIGILIPSSWLFAFQWKLGVAGLMYGVLVASSVSIIMLSGRFYWLQRKDQIYTKNLC